ncbi:lipopolysaccharide cholinephosphotransferase, partial [Streptococcus pneumoniae]|nr:lipopolysaccharide cholinephosphotransferase [Streptococcus pneumoniae]
MNQTEMVKLIQKVELDAIKEFQKICKENNI